MPTLNEVKAALNITGDFQDPAITAYVEEVTEFLKGAGVKPERMTAGLIARGVADLWNYGAGEGKLSEYFMQRAAQLAL